MNEWMHEFMVRMMKTGKKTSESWAMQIFLPSQFIGRDSLLQLFHSCFSDFHPSTHSWRTLFHPWFFKFPKNDVRRCRSSGESIPTIYPFHSSAAPPHEDLRFPFLVSHLWIFWIWDFVPTFICIPIFGKWIWKWMISNWKVDRMHPNLVLS